MSDKVLVQCAAVDHVLALHLDSDEHQQFYLSLYIGQWYAKQSSFLGRWMERFKIAFTVLRGNEYCFEDVVLTRDDADAVRRFLDKALALHPPQEGSQDA